MNIKRIDIYIYLFVCLLLQLSEEGFNCSLYWLNKDVRRFVSVVPTSAQTGEGIADLVHLICSLNQTLMQKTITKLPSIFDCKEDAHLNNNTARGRNLQCTILEVKAIEVYTPPPAPAPAAAHAPAAAPAAGDAPAAAAVCSCGSGAVCAAVAAAHDAAGFRNSNKNYIYIYIIHLNIALEVYENKNKTIEI